MSKKNKNTKSLGDLFILGFTLTSFSLLLVDGISRFSETNANHSSPSIVVPRAQAAPLSKVLKNEIYTKKTDEAEPSQEELEKLILENFGGEAGG